MAANNAITDIRTGEEVLAASRQGFTEVTMMMGGGFKFFAWNLRGWMWTLLARDHVEGVTYRACESAGCDREVSELSYEGRGKMLRYSVRAQCARTGNASAERVQRLSASWLY
jgi:hypothetical protein